MDEPDAFAFDAYLLTNNPSLYRRLKAMPKATKIKNKFYVGSPKMNPLSSDGSAYRIWSKATLAEAVEHAKEKCEETGEPQIVVQIIKVVRPQRSPIVVENA